MALPPGIPNSQGLRPSRKALTPKSDPKGVNLDPTTITGKLGAPCAQQHTCHATSKASQKGGGFALPHQCAPCAHRPAPAAASLPDCRRIRHQTRGASNRPRSTVMMLHMTIQPVPNNERLRQLIEASGLSQLEALALFNRGQVKQISLSSWRSWLAAPDSARRRNLSDAYLHHAERLFSRMSKVR